MCVIDVLSIIGRSSQLFEDDLSRLESETKSQVSDSTFLVLGGGGSIGRSVVKELFKHAPRVLHVVDLSENSLAELVRDVRSELDWLGGDFKTFTLDIGSTIYDQFIEDSFSYDYVLNLSALKHVRSEKDPYTLMRMLDTNIFNTVKTLRQSQERSSKKYFCVSTDKAANPVNLMGGSKKIMELYALSSRVELPVCSARFANVAFSAGSLLDGFKERINKNQPIVVPQGIQRFFVTEQEAGQLCVLSCLFGDDGDIFFPKPSPKLQLQDFFGIAERFVAQLGFEPAYFSDVAEAREAARHANTHKRWPVITQVSDTTGEKPYEEFFTKNETLDFDTFHTIGVVKRGVAQNDPPFHEFEQAIKDLRDSGKFTKTAILNAMKIMLPELEHDEKFKNLDEKM